MKKWSQLLKFGRAKCYFTSMSNASYLITVGQFIGNVFWACKQVSGKTTRPIWLKFTSKVSFGMASDWLGFDYCVAIFVAIIAISNYNFLFLVNRFKEKLLDQLCWNSYAWCSVGWPLIVTLTLLQFSVLLQTYQTFKQTRFPYSQCLHWPYGVTTNVGQLFHQSVSQWVHPSYMSRNLVNSLVQSIACNDVQLWYIVFNDYVLKYIW